MVPAERELLTFCIDNHVMAIKENGLGIGFSDQWSICSDQRYMPPEVEIHFATHGAFMSSVGCQLCDSLQFLHDGLAQLLRAGTGYRADLKYGSVPL